MPTLDRQPRAAPLPRIIQGGMGIAVSNYRLARAVALTGQLGVVAGTALEHVLTRRLQLGDEGGELRRAFARFPLPGVAERVLAKYFIAGGKDPGAPFKGVPMFTRAPSRELVELTVLAHFTEVSLAREGHTGPLGVNYLYKTQLPLLASMFGAILAGVEYVIVGAGNPEQVPEALSRMVRLEEATLELSVQYAGAEDPRSISLSPRELLEGFAPELRRPRMLAIVASVELAEALTRNLEPPDGFVIEGPTAGGHNAPPRGPLRLDVEGQPIYGPLDAVDLSLLRALGPPFWLAGGYGAPGGLRAALQAGAAGIQVGTAFAFCEESGFEPSLRERVLREVLAGSARVFTDPRASPSGFPFKVVQLEGTLSSSAIFEARPRTCDVGGLRAPFKGPSGELGYRCPAEPDTIYQRKGGRVQNTHGRKCLCNALLANVGLGQVRRGYAEPPLLTAGDDLTVLSRLLCGGTSYRAADVVRALLEGVATEPTARAASDASS